MKIKLEEKELKAIDTKIISSDTVIQLQTDINATFIGVLLLNNNSKKIIDFIKADSNEYQARLIITSDELSYLKEAKLNLILIDGTMKQSTNYILPKFDIELIKKDIRIKVSNEIEDVNIKLKEIQNVINSLLSSKVLQELKIQNKEYIQPGMIPVSIDDKGNCVMMYPFSNHIVEINGAKAINGVVVLDASMIKYKLGKDIESSLDDHADAISKLAGAVKELSSNLKSIRDHLDEIDIKLEQHINNGII